MTRCERCGAEPVEGRFCTGCGHPLQTEQTTTSTLAADDWRTDTAERPAIEDRTVRMAPVIPGSPQPAPTTAPPRTPPAQEAAPGDGPRFPLYADEILATRPASAPPAAPAPEQLAPTPVDDRGSRRWLPVTVVGVALALLALFGFWLVTGPLGSSGKPRADQAKAGAGSGASAGDLTRDATAHVPATAPPNQDTSGNLVHYDARQMLDGVPTTCWRMVGDGTGGEIAFDLGQQSRITTVGLINGYAKSARDAGGRVLDWYHGDRRVLTVEWSFDDGTTLTQQLDDTRQMQTVDLDQPVTTSTVHLRLVKVSPPGRGPAARNYTAISDVTLRGSAA